MTESFRISKARARLIFDSRGDYTVEVELESNGRVARASAPAGKSRGRREVEYYPRNNAAEAVRIFNEIVSPKIVGLDPADQRGFDDTLHEIDGTERFERIGGNTAYAASAAASILASMLREVPIYVHVSEKSGMKPKIPMPLGNVLGGGAHAGEGAPDIQEILVFPTGVEDPLEAVRTNITIHKELGRLLTGLVEGFTRGKGDEGAYAPNMRDDDALAAVKKTVDNINAEGARVRMGVDMASSNLYDPSRGMYIYRRSGLTRTRRQQLEYVVEIVERFGLGYVEDPMAEDDMEGFAELVKQVGGKTLVCGDDLLTTNAKQVSEAAKMKAVNAMIIKPNQVGTLTDTFAAAREAERSNIVKVVSHRSGETCSVFLSHLAVGLGAELIKSGVVGGERIAKANELLRIWEGEKLPLARP
ncbi:MAG TPA: phosphopyruvate hydratase [Candidatus Caldiarchaeum subterraneum]|uniref:Enolase n=1 Tax=Caldiarchaeum subterraneum TaxID=311458 RepID=A0A832ZUP6_CALS0|nr:phosphopyruvate hydratase [Candidatus Caldarchaeum subterraneum]